jgi:hypothetical protein
MVPGGTYSFVMWAGDAKGGKSKKSNTATVTLPVDTTPPAAPVVSVTGTSASTVGLAWGPVADDDSTCCTYRVFANGALVNGVFLHSVDRHDRADGAGPLRGRCRRLRDVALVEQLG